MNIKYFSFVLDTLFLNRIKLSFVKVAFTLLLGITSVSANAAVYPEVYKTIRNIEVIGTHVLVRLDGHEDIPTPACGTNAIWTFGFELDGTDENRAFYTMLLLAQSTDRPVKFAFEDMCIADYGNDITRLRWLRLKNY